MHRLILAGLLCAGPAVCSQALADPAAHLAAGNAWRALDEFGAALREYEAGLRETPGRADLLAERALTLHRLGETDAARAEIARAIAAAGPRDAGPLTARAGLALLAGRNAEADLTEALRRAPDDRRALALLALVVARQGGAPLPPRVMEALRQDFGPWLSD
jgi:tetratricopeptide (TPR) repeat protein